MVYRIASVEDRLRELSGGKDLAEIRTELDDLRKSFHLTRKRGILIGMAALGLGEHVLHSELDAVAAAQCGPPTAIQLASVVEPRAELTGASGLRQGFTGIQISSPPWPVRESKFSP
jgi:hypothetical protein